MIWNWFHYWTQYLILIVLNAQCVQYFAANYLLKRNGGNTDPGASWWPATKRKQLLVSNENSTTMSMDSLVKFCDENKLLKTPFVIADVTIPPENVPCFDFLVLFAIVVFLLFFLLIAYCCYRCRLKRRWVGGNKKEKLLHNNQGQRSNKSICGGSSITELVSKLYDFSFENNAL